jgi:hypothetical protein
MHSQDYKIAGVNEGPTRIRASRGPFSSFIGVVIAVTACFLFFPIHTSAQSPIPTGRTKSFDVSLGYSYFSHEDSQSNLISLNGADASLTIGLSNRLGISGDFGYAVAAHALGTNSHSEILSYLAGPVFYPTSQGNVNTYIHAMFGGARVAGPIPVVGGTIIGSWVTDFAWEVGGGVNYRISDSFGIRTGVDYMRTTFFDRSLNFAGQNNIRATVSLVYSFGNSSHKRRRR